MNITVSTKFKHIMVDGFTTINYDFLDISKYVLFIWKNEVIVASIVIDPNREYSIDIWDKNDKLVHLTTFNDLNKYINE